jgi:hypothetical protein
MFPHVLNLYAITNAADLRARYRLVDIEGSVGEDDLADQNLSLLAKRVALEEHRPVALVRPGGRPALAVPADLSLTRSQYQLTPHVVELRPREEEHELNLGHLTTETERIGLSFLSFHLRSPLFRHPDLWSSGPATYFAKRPVNYRENRRDVDVYEGFSFRVLRFEGGLFLSLTLTNKYSDRRWLLERYHIADVPQLKMRHLLYHTGRRWFPVQLLSVTGMSVRDQKFVMDDQTVRTVYGHAIQTAGEDPPEWIRALPPDSPAITFQYPGSGKMHHGAAALCKLLLSTSDEAVRRLHRYSIIPPDDRFRRTADVLRENFFGVQFEGVPLKVEDRALRIEPKHFPVPAQRFGQGRVLKPEEVGLAKLGTTRLGYLLDPRGGLAVHSPLGAQFIFLPDTLDRKAAGLFQEGLENTMRSFLHAPYEFRPVVYANDRKRTLRDQVEAILQASTSGGTMSGHGVLVLPENGAPDLHNYIKRRLHSRIQFQCVAARKMQGFYKQIYANGRSTYEVDPERGRHYESYLRYTAIGLLLVNRRWPWVLDQPTHYDAYVGVDVLRNTAAFAFFYEGGRKCFVRLEESQQDEKVPRKKVAAVVYRYLKDDLAGGLRPVRSVIFRRDGRAFADEVRGFRDAVTKLIQDGVLPKDVRVGVVEVHKTFALGLRLVVEEKDGFVNPRIGSWERLSDREAILCMTGYPFRFEGTVKPLYLRLVWGDIELANVAEDTFAMSQLCWPVPDRCMRLPVDLKLCDDLLRANASEADEEEAIYGDDESSLGEEPELETPSSLH